MDLHDKTFFVTGGAQGLGKSYTQAVLDNGAKVFFGDVNASAGEKTLRELQAEHGKARVKFQAFDVTDKSAFKDAFAKAVSEFGHVDVMVNNAGIMNEGLWELMVKINLNAVIQGTKLAVEHMRKDKGGKGGRVVNICSVAGMHDYFFLSIYCATKHAVRSYTTGLSKQPTVQAQGVEYGMLCPGSTATDLVANLDETRIDFPDQFVGRLNNIAMSTDTVTDAFLKLVTLEVMNGAILVVETSGVSFKKMAIVDAQPPATPSE